MDKLMTAIGLLPSELRDIPALTKYGHIEEIRLRSGRKPTVYFCGREEAFLDKTVSPQEIAILIEKACGASLQVHLHEIKEGYINYKGLRIGVCGAAIYTEDKLRAFRSFSSVNIRIPHEFSGDVSGLIKKMQCDDYQSTLLISPPGYGKTSLLRELIRRISTEGKRISVVDERNELACMEEGICYFDMGEKTDILTGVKKSEGAMMLLRGMNPAIIAFDEISKSEDLAAIYEIAGCGVDILATAHGRDISSLSRRPIYRQLLSEKIFKNLITINVNGVVREYNFQRIEL